MTSVQIKKKARRLILSIMSEEKQRNSLAELIALQATPLIDWTAEMVVTFQLHKEVWAMIDSIRKVSNQLEAGEDVQWPI